MINFDSKKIIYFILFFSLVIGLGLNEYNLQLIKEKNPNNVLINCQSTVENETVWGVDDEYYTTPPENFLAGKGWRRDPPLGDGTYFRRVPGYSLIYLFFRLLFDLPLALKFLKFFQVFLFGVSVLCVHKITRYLRFNSALSACIALMFGCTPFFNSFAYSTCTESISPYLCVFYLYFLIKAYVSNDAKKKSIAYLIAGLFLGISILTRPNMALLAIAIPFCIRPDHYKGLAFFPYLKNIGLIAVIPLLLLGTWTLRNFILTKEIVILEKAAHPESLDRVKPELEGILDFAKCWGSQATFPTDFNTWYVPFQESVLIQGDSSNVHIENILSAWPSSIIEEFGRGRLFAILKKHQAALFRQKPYYDKQIAMPSTYFVEQLEVAKEYEDLKKEYIHKNFMSYWFKSPFLYFRTMTLHSNTSQLFMFEKEQIGNKMLFIYKGLLFFFHIILYLSIFINLFLIKDWFLKSIFAITPLISIFFFCFIFRLIEQRYMLPILPITVIGLAFPLKYLLSIRRSP